MGEWPVGLEFVTEECSLSTALQLPCMTMIRPALAANEIVLCDRFYDSTVAYQGHGRQLDLQAVREMIDFAVGQTRPDLTLLLIVSEQTSEERRLARQATLQFMRDRMEEADREFFIRVARGYDEIAKEEPERVRRIDGSGSVPSIETAIWEIVKPLLK